MVCIGKSNRLEKFDLEARCELLAAPQSGDCNEVNKIMARGEILKKKRKKKKKKKTLLFRLSDGMVKNILNVYYNIMFFHQKVKKILVLKPYINIYNTSEQQIFINL